MTLEQTAREAGFETISLEGVFNHLDVERIYLRPWDQHPNAIGHAHIADALTEALLEPDMARRLGLH